MIKQLLSLSLVIGKFYLAGKVLIWVYEKMNNPEIHSINEIEWVLVLILLDTWLLTHLKIEITDLLQKKDKN
jgi:hypothetical protein